MGGGAVVFWLLVWQVASVVVDSGFILAGPMDTLDALVRLLPTGDFWRQIGFSTLRIVGGMLAGYVVSFACAAAAWRWSWVRALLRPALSAIKGTPVACVAVVLLIWFGSRNVSAIAVFLMVLPGVYFPVLTGLDELDRGQRELFDVFGAGRLTRLFALVWPGILPYVTACSQTVLGMSWKAGVAAELIGVPTGSIGERIYQAKLLLETADLFAWTIVVVLISWAFERVVLAALRASWPATARLANVPKGDGAVLAHSVPVVKAQDMEVGYEGIAVCEPLSFELYPGQTLCLTAPSGKGKTTLLRTIAGLQKPVSGSLCGAGTAASRPIAMVFQSTCLLDDLTAVENTRLFAAHETSEQSIRSLLGELLPADALDQPVRELSGGQRRRLELVRAFAASGAFILLDEPFTGLDVATHQRALAFIRRHQGARAIVMATHDPKDATALGARVLSL